MFRDSEILMTMTATIARIKEAVRIGLDKMVCSHHDGLRSVRKTMGIVAESRRKTRFRKIDTTAGKVSFSQTH
jgi:hypothetical protein